MKALSKTFSPVVVELDCDKDDPKTRFTIAPLRNSVYRQIEDRTASVDTASKEGALDIKAGTRQIELVRYGLVALEDFCDADGNEVKLETDMTSGNVTKVRMSFIDRLPRPALVELANKIAEITELTGREREALGFT